MIVAEFEIFHSRPIAPTRRLALGARNLPIDGVPGAGGLLLAGVVAQSAEGIEPELCEDLLGVIELISRGERVTQPRVRHRFQTDRIGLTRSVQRLVSEGGALSFELETANARPVQLTLGAVYAAGTLPASARRSTFEAITTALTWRGEPDARFVEEILGGNGAKLADLVDWNDPVAWALGVLELAGRRGTGPGRRVIQKQFRRLLREAHPDHGGSSGHAADRIHDLTEARRILSAR